jgi:hypothetical protein
VAEVMTVADLCVAQAVQCSGVAAHFLIEVLQSDTEQENNAQKLHQWQKVRVVGRCASVRLCSVVAWLRTFWSKSCAAQEHHAQELHQ